MDDLVTLERKVQGLYDKALYPLAERVEYDLPMTLRDAPGLPSVLFLGNHSSGKSSFINYLIQSELQKTGLAPTDDGFTIITYGEKRDEFDGQTVVTHRDLAYKHLQRFGPALLSRLRLKTFPHEMLKTITLIDSPGMIDAAGTGNTRGYDFAASVRYFAETADLILFFFDPDKPGTTGETVSIFTETLAGLEHKLLIIMNKVDLFSNIRDFARTYGTLCWNLSKTLKTKDIPHIYNIYLPGFGRGDHEPAARHIPLRDFDVSRDEVVAEIKRAPTRRADNLVSDLYQNGQKLAVHARACYEVARRYRMMRLRFWTGAGLVLILTGLIAWLTWNPDDLRVPVATIAIGLFLTGSLVAGCHFYLNRFKQRITTPEGIEPFFERAYRQELTLRQRADLRARWESVKNQAIATLNALGPEKIGGSFSTRKLLKRLESVLENDVPNLRRDIAEHHRQLRERPVAE